MKLKKYITNLAMMTLSLALTVGCSSSEESTKQTTEVKPGEEVVVATSVAVTEILDELGVKVSGIPTTSYDLPESVKDTTEVGSPMNPDMEIIKSLNPTVVVSVDTLGEDYKNTFIENNIPSEFVNLTNVDGLKETIKTLGERFDKTDRANEILKELSDKEKALENNEKTDEKVMILFGAPGSVMVGTDKCYTGNLLDICGGNNVFAGGNSSYIQVNMEEIIKANPDKIIVTMHALPEETKKTVEQELAKDTWKNINAVKNNKVFYLDSEYFGMSANLKTIEALDLLGDILYEQ